MNKSILGLILLFSFCIGYSQTTIKGKIVAETSSLENINIINLSNKNVTASDALGYFEINAKPQDTLAFSAVNIVGISVVLKPKDFSNKLYFVRLKTKINELDEVNINNKINAVSLGIIPKGVKRYTPAERRLKAASDLDPTLSAGMMAGGSIGIDPIINAITGRTKKLKKELDIEKKERNLTRLNDYYTSEYFTQKLHIPENYIDGFLVFALDNTKIVDALKAKNKTLLDFLLPQIAPQFLQTIEVKQN